jgi:hypothetical protein
MDILVSKSEENYCVQPVAIEKEFSECWLNFVTLQMDKDLFIKVLERIHLVIPHLREPVRLMDFFVDVYNNGVVV